jgi:hypothetical protein
MGSETSSQDYLARLYNGYSAVAERVEPKQLERIHIVTKLDSQVERWLSTGSDVVLTGNPGDGKTHLIRMLECQGELASSHAEKDASQRDVEEVLRTWLSKKGQGIPFLLAINHAPLRELAEKAIYHPSIADLRYIPEEINGVVFYNEPSARRIPFVSVVDLSQRDLVTEEIVTELCRKLCSIAVEEPCPFCPPRRCPIEYNTEALSNPKILGHVLQILSLVEQRGFHITMRDLVGLFAYIIVGDRLCEGRWEPRVDDEGIEVFPSFDDYAYYNLLFSGRSRLFDAIRATFDPANYTDTESDMRLWMQPRNYSWLMTNPAVVQPATLAELRILKRRYFFEEQSHDSRVLVDRMLNETERGFNRLISGTNDSRSEVERVIAMINAVYAPQSGGLEHPHLLRLWNTHRYSIGTTPGYVAMRTLSRETFQIYYPRVAPHLVDAMEIRRDHVLFGVKNWEVGDPALRIDWPMYQCLAAALGGRPIDAQPFHILRRLDLFLRQLGPYAGGTREIENIEVSTPRHRRLSSIRVSRRMRCYVGEQNI